MAREFLTDEQVEREIERLNASPEVALARRYQRLKYRRRQYLYQLRDLEKKGKALEDAGITREVLDEMCEEEFDEIECREGAVLGDIVISIERAKEQAKEVGNTFHHEVAFLTVHSVLHLLGYDHERSPIDEEDQCQRQRAIIENVDI